MCNIWINRNPTGASLANYANVISLKPRNLKMTRNSILEFETNQPMFFSYFDTSSIEP